MPDKQEIGITLAALRGAHAMTQQQLAEAAGINHAQVSRYEKGREMPNPRTLDNLMKALCVNHTEFHTLLRFLCNVVGRTDLEGEGDDAPYETGSGMRLRSELREGGSSDLLASPGVDAEVERLADDAGQLVSRAVRLLFSTSADKT